MRNGAEESKRAKVYITPNGGQYVKADELLQNPEVIKEIETMRDIFAKRRSKEQSLEEKE